MAGYVVIGLATNQRLVDGIRIVETIEGVAITKPHDVNFSVIVDKTEGWKERLAAALAAEAAELESVFDL